MRGTHDIIGELAERGYVEGIIRRMKVCSGEDPENLRDLAQDIYLYMLMNRDRIEELWEVGELNYYMTGVIRRQVFSDSSDYYVNYKRDKRVEDAEDRADDGGI